MEDCFNTIYNSFLAQKMGHAFLIETNNIDKTCENILELAKKLNCPGKYKEDCEEDCDICFQINNFCLPSIKFIEPIGQTIKKEQILNMKKSFNSNSLVTKYNIYIIKHAEKLNSASANVLLKFLEEPSTDTLAFFVLNNKKNIIPTIKSRCQVFSDSIDLETEQNEELSNFEKKFQIIFQNLYQEKAGSFIKNKELINSISKEKKEQEKFLLYIHKELVNILNLKIAKNKESKAKDFRWANIQNLVNLIQLTEKVIEKATYNVNMELLLDEYFIKMGELIE